MIAYVDIQEAISNQKRILKEFNVLANRIRTWLNIFKYIEVCKAFEAKFGN